LSSRSFYYSTAFLKSTGTISDPFLTSMIFTIVNVCSTPISFYTVEKFGRRPLLIYGAGSMMVCQFIIAIVGVTVGFNKTALNAAGESIAQNTGAVNAQVRTVPSCDLFLPSLADSCSASQQVAFIAIFIFFFASTCASPSFAVVVSRIALTRLVLRRGSGRVGPHRRDLPAADPLARCRSLDGVQLAVEHHHRRYVTSLRSLAFESSETFRPLGDRV